MSSAVRVRRRQGRRIPTTQPPTPPAPPKVPLAAGANLAAAVAANPAGTWFLLANGTYNPNGVVPKNNMTFEGVSRAGVVLDGGSSFSNAFTGSASGVTLMTQTVQHYNSARLFGAIDLRTTLNWTLLDLHVTNNSAEGIAVGPGTVVDGCLCDYNGNVGIGTGDVYNFAGTFPFAGLFWFVRNCELAYNGALDAADAAGAKMLWSAAGQFVNNNVHHNYGFGLWDDAWCTNIVYDSNHVHHNAAGGIFNEIGNGGTIIRNNETDNNAIGWGDPAQPALFYPGSFGIGVSDTPDTQVYGNNVHDNLNAIAGYDGHSLSRTTNLLVHGNTISGGHTGMQNVSGPGSVFSTSHFYSNTYGTIGGYWWSTGQTNAAGWAALGQS